MNEESSEPAKREATFSDIKKNVVEMIFRPNGFFRISVQYGIDTTEVGSYIRPEISGKMMTMLIQLRQELQAQGGILIEDSFSPLLARISMSFPDSKRIPEILNFLFCDHVFA
jgi:hypothetical protein